MNPNLELTKIIIFGNGKMGEIIYQSIIRDCYLRPVAWTADKEYVTSDNFYNLPLISFETIERLFPPNKFKMLITLSGKNMRYRKECFDKARKKGYEFVNFISRSSKIFEDLNLGVNNIICENVYIGPFSKMSNNNIIRPNTYIGHDASIENHNIICPGCNLSGYSQVNNLCFIGIGSTIIEKISINDETLIGAGSVVLKDTDPHSVYVGNPARKIKTHENTGIIQ